MKIPLYRHGQWTNYAHPLADNDNGDYDQLMNNAGYSRLTHFHPGGDERSLTLTVWVDGANPRRPYGQRDATGSPKYLVDVDFPGEGETVAVDNIVDLMTLLSTWTPVVKAALVCDDSLQRQIKNNS